METARKYLNQFLEDDSTPYGGKSFADERLYDFLDEIGMDYDTPMNIVNKSLVECGLEPINL